MENATDALIMAGQILVFIIALTVCMSSFTTLRANITALIEQPETIKMTVGTDSEGNEGYLNYIESKKSNSIRVVSAETVVSSMYRAVKENYVVYIKLNSPVIVPTDPKQKQIGIGEGTFEINDESGRKSGKVIVIRAKEDLKIGDTNLINKDSDWLIKVTIGRQQEGINEKVNNLLRKENFYYLIKDKTFNEYLGEYQDGTEVSTENKLTKRIITYIEK